MTARDELGKSAGIQCAERKGFIISARSALLLNIGQVHASDFKMKSTNISS